MSDSLLRKIDDDISDYDKKILEIETGKHSVMYQVTRNNFKPYVMSDLDKEYVLRYKQILGELKLKKNKIEKNMNKLSDIETINPIDPNKHNGIFSYGDITFDLKNRTLEIGDRNGNKKIKNIDRPRLKHGNLGNKTFSTIMLLYCIIIEAKNGNFVIGKKFDYYKKHADKYKFLIGRKQGIDLPAKFGDYISGVTTLLDISNSGYEITRKSGDNPKKFQKKITNKS